MTVELLDAALFRLRRLATGPAPDPRDDRRLLRAFAFQRSEPAFAELVARHGPMVLAVCRRVLHNRHDAEDAFQAAFLVLARKAGTGPWHTSIAAWLHEVACRVAREARACRFRRREALRQMQAIPKENDTMTEIEGRDRDRVVDEEVRRLPRRYREAVVLCYLEGLSRVQAAQRLGWSERTLDRRLARARELLRARLSRQGLAPEGTPNALPLWAVAPAGVPAALSESAVRGAASFAFGGEAGCGPAAVALARGVLGTMAAARLKAVAVLALVLGLAVVGAGTAAWPYPATQPPQPRRPVPAAARPGTDRHGDPLPAGAVTRLGTVRFRHMGWHKKVLFTPDGKTLLTGAENNSLRFWDPRTGKLLGKIETDPVFEAIALSPNGQTLASAGRAMGKHGFPDQPVIRFWDVATRKEIRTLALAKDDGVERLAFSPNGELLLGSGKGVRVWDVKTGTEILRYKLGGQAGFLALSPDGKTVAGADRTHLYLWQWQTEKEPRAIKTGRLRFLSLAFSPDGKTLAGTLAAPPGDRVRLWDVARGRVKLRINDERTHYSRGLAFSPDGKFLATRDDGSRAGQGWSGGLTLWDGATGKLDREFPTPGESVGAVCFSADGKWLAAATSGGVHVWELRTGREVGWGEAAHRNTLTALSASAGGRLATASDDHTVRLWEGGTGKYLRALQHGHWVRSAALSPDGSKVASSSLDNHVYLWDAHTGKLLYKLFGHGRHGGGRLVSFTPDGKRFLSFGDDYYLRVWEVATGKALVEHRLRPKGVPVLDEDAEPSEEREMMRMRYHIEACEASPDGKTFVLGLARKFHVFDVATGKERRTLDNPGGHVVSVSVSPGAKHLLTSSWGRGVEKKLPDGKVWFTSSRDHPICLWDLSTGKILRKRVLPDGGAGPVAFSPDGKTYAVSVRKPGHKITLHDTASGKELRSFDRVGGRVSSMAFTPDGKKLLTGMNDTSVLVWDLMAGGKTP